MSGLYLAGFYAQGSDRLWASVLMLVVVLLGVGLAYCWYGWRLRQVQPEHAGRLSDTAQPQEGSLSVRQQLDTLASHRRRKAWVAVIEKPLDVSTADDQAARRLQESDTALFIPLPDSIPIQEVRTLRGRFRPPLDGVMLVASTLPGVGSLALQQLLEFNQRSGWRLPLCLALSGWTVPADGVVCQLTDASNTETTARDLQQLAWTLAVEGQADVLRQASDNKRLALSAALDKPEVIKQLAQQLRHQPAATTGAAAGAARLGGGQRGATPHHHDTALAAVFATSAPAVAQRQGWLGSHCHGRLAVIGVALSFQHNFQMIQQARQQRQALQQAAALTAALPTLAAVQQQITQLQQAQRQGLPWWWRLGLNQLPAVQQALLDGYGKAARRWLVEPARQNLRQVLQALNALPLTTGDNALLQQAQRQGYDSLKAYLMLDQPARAQPAFLTAQLLQADGLAHGRRADVLRFYSQQLPSQAGWRQAAEPTVVAAARQTLLSLNGIEHDDATLYKPS
jgi:type VI secretion system protein ImpL